MTADCPDLPFDQESAERHRQGRLLDWQRPSGSAASISVADPQPTLETFLETCRWQDAPTGKRPLARRAQLSTSTVGCAVLTAAHIRFVKVKTRPSPDIGHFG
jgi:hypothetical protein